MASKGLCCPTCGKPRNQFDPVQSLLPFCSLHCKQADLGKWMVGMYSISRPLNVEEIVEIEMQLEEQDDAVDRN